MRHLFLISALVFLFFSGCGKGGDESAIALPPTPVLENRDSWAVNLTRYAAVRSAPDADSEMLTQLARGQILRIIERTGRKEKAGENEDYWYRVEDGRSRGWIFGANLVIFPSHEEASRYRLE